MSLNNHCCDDPMECPLCMEPLEMDDLNFFPCTCGYQICRFCWHRIRTDENGLCPACRKPYPENPADFKPLSQEELQNIKQEKRQKDLLRKQKVTENRKHLANVRVVQKNLVFVVGLSTRLAEIEMLKKAEYFGKFGKIHKVVINHSTAYAGSQGPSASAYVTYQRAEDALKAIQAVNNIYVDGRTLKASLGTTKYCSHFMKNQQCPKSDCMYLHELGDESASFTKEEMQQGKHQEFEKRLQEQYLGSSTVIEKPNGLCSLITGIPLAPDYTPPVNGTAPSVPPTSKKSKLVDSSKPVVTVVSNTARGEGWPALSASPPTHKEHSKKSKKSEKNSARQTPTDEQVKRNDKKEKRIHKDKSNVNQENRNTRSTSGSQDSGNSSASATPPLLTAEEIAPPHSNLFKPSSPLPVISAKTVLSYDPESNSSPIGTTPSSLSSCSEPSLSLPNAAISVTPPESITSTFPEPIIYSQIELPRNDEQIPNILPSDHIQLEAKRAQVLPQSIPNGDHNPRNLEWINQFDDHYSRESLSQWNPIEYSTGIEDLSVIERQLDDELGFDPFEETTKALAEDIIIERKLLEQQKQRQFQIQQQLHAQHQQKQLQSMQQQHHLQQMSQAQVMQSNIKNVLEFPNLPTKDLSTRLPPPGFNGMGLGNNFPLSHPGIPTSQSHLSKLAQPFMGAMNPQPTMVNTNSPPPHQINGYIGPNKIGVPPGLVNNILNGHSSNSVHNALPTGMHPHQMSGTLLNYEQPFGVGLTPSVHPNIKPNNTDPLALKDLETSMSHSMRNISNIMPIINSVSSMNSVNNMNSIATGNSHPQIHMPPQNPLANLLNYAHQQQHPSSSQNLLQQLGTNTLSAHKGWWKEAGSTELSSLDPAIVSSGQLTDSRTQSPPHWMKSLDQIGSESHSWNNMLPYNVISGALNGHFNGIIPPQTQQRGSIWPPTSPPPGFNSISPLHAKQREAHNIENL